MGGRNTLYMAFTYPELFGYVGVFSSASVLPDETYGHVNPLLILTTLLGHITIISGTCSK